MTDVPDLLESPEPAEFVFERPPVLADLLGELRPVRIRAITRLATEPELAYALRRVLYTDRDAEVRAAAARQLGDLELRDVDGRLNDWLIDALGDVSPLVREAVLRSLAKRAVGSGLAIAKVRTLVASERLWWVRRTAVYTLAALGGADEVPALKAVLSDPFWRVRHAAVRVLAALGARDLEVRDQVINAPATPTLAFLRAAWGPVAVEPPRRAAIGTSALPPALLDPDPAVVTARLLDTRDVSPVALVELLCDPHVPLRLLAAERVAAAGDHAAFVAALDWLEEPRVPHVAETVEQLLDQLGDRAAAVAAHALARPGRTGAARWAIGWTVATRSETLYAAAIDRARADVALRHAAVRLASNDELLAWADAELTDRIAIELHERRAPDAHAALLALDTAAHPTARALQVDAAARRDQWTRVEAALADPHHGPRAIATRWIVRARGDATAQLRDPDPAVREAALNGANGAHAAAFVADPDPWVARAAIEQLVAASHHRPERELAEAAALALGSTDPWIRTRACLLPITSPDVLALVVEALADADEMVRAAALDALERTSNLDARLRELAPRSALGRRMLHAWLHGEALRGAAPAHVTVEAPRPRRAPATVEHRAFGRAGFDVAPLAISGAFDPGLPALRTAADAGVNLWFWEPAYDNLTRFLRDRGDHHVIAGSYHADARSIEADVDRACKQLRRDTLDVFLLFWTRSSARVDPAAYAAIAALKRSGKVRALGFSTHHRELARTAIEASPWDVVMIRHSAAHPGIETELLPTARALGTAIITFSALTYGRMLSGPGAPSPADCYRYSLSQPGVSACISAPRRRTEVVENVDVLRAPVLTDERIAALRVHGLGVRAENQRFNALLRQPTRDAAEAARALLASELPPSDELVQRALPRPSRSRPARTNLGKTRTHK